MVLNGLYCQDALLPEAPVLSSRKQILAQLSAELRRCMNTCTFLELICAEHAALHAE